MFGRRASKCIAQYRDAGTKKRESIINWHSATDYTADASLLGRARFSNNEWRKATGDETVAELACFEQVDRTKAANKFNLLRIQGKEKFK